MIVLAGLPRRGLTSIILAGTNDVVGHDRDDTSENEAMGIETLVKLTEGRVNDFSLPDHGCYKSGRFNPYPGHEQCLTYLNLLCVQCQAYPLRADDEASPSEWQFRVGKRYHD